MMRVSLKEIKEYAIQAGFETVDEAVEAIESILSYKGNDLVKGLSPEQALIEKATRLSLKEQTETSKAILRFIEKYDKMTKHEKAKALTKFVVSNLMGLAAGGAVGKVVKGLPAVGKVGGKEKIPVKTVESKALKNPSVKEALNTELAVATKVDKAANAATFTPGYDLSTKSTHLKTKNSYLELNTLNPQQISKARSFKNVVIQRSSPAEIHHGFGKLSKRQAEMLEKLTNNKLEITVRKSDFNVTDLAALTAKTGDEFAMFTLDSRRLIVRGDSRQVFLTEKLLNKLKNENWKWSAHTHPGTSQLVLDASGVPGDRLVLQTLDQQRSLILNSAGRKNVFDRNDNLYISPKIIEKNDILNNTVKKAKVK